MRILLVVDGRYPGFGGAEIQVRTLCREFLSQGHDVSVVCPRLDHSKPRQEIIDDVQVTRISYPKIKLAGAIILLLKYSSYLLRNKNRYDAIHVHMVKNLAALTGIFSPFLKAKTAAKISGAWEFEGGVLDPRKRDKLLYVILNNGIKKLDFVQCVSRYTAEQVAAAGYPEKAIKLIPNGVDLSRFPQRQWTEVTSSLVTLVYTGRLRYVKGVDVLLEAWKLLSEKSMGQTLRLNIVGDGDELPALKQYAKRHLLKNIQFMGKRDDVVSILSQSDIYVQPSRQEGLSNSVLEAMAMGLPIVATEVSGNQDLVKPGENGLLVPAENPYALAQAMKKMIADRDMARKMGGVSRRIIESNYAVDSVVSELIRHYL